MLRPQTRYTTVGADRVAQQVLGEELCAADLLQVDGNLLETLDLVADPDKNFVMM